jgi:hypothetical protein
MFPSYLRTLGRDELLRSHTIVDIRKPIPDYRSQRQPALQHIYARSVETNAQLNEHIRCRRRENLRTLCGCEHPDTSCKKEHVDAYHDELHRRPRDNVKGDDGDEEKEYGHEYADDCDESGDPTFGDIHHVSLSFLGLGWSVRTRMCCFRVSKADLRRIIPIDSVAQTVLVYPHSQAA